MQLRNLFRFLLALIAAIEVTSKPIKDFRLVIHNDTGSRTIWQNIGTRSFYGPWDMSVKRNGDYVDYNDYGVPIEHFRPNLLSYDDVPMSNRYVNALPSVYDSVLPEFNTLFSSVGLADFRTGVRTGLDQSKY